MSDTFYIREFPIDELPISCSWIIIGNPGSGKTALCHDLAYVYKHRYPVAKIFSGSEDSNRQYEKVYPQIIINEGYVEEDEQMHIIRQKRCKENGCENGAALNIIDDCSDDKRIYKSKTFIGLYKNGTNHWNQMMITLLQYGIDFPTDVRKCTSYVAIFFESEPNERDKLYKNFGGACGSYKDFCAIMDQLIEIPDPSDSNRETDKHTCLIIRKMGQGPKRENNVFYYKARLHPNFKFGCEELWKWDRERRDPNKGSSYGL